MATKMALRHANMGTPRLPDSLQERYPGVWVRRKKYTSALPNNTLSNSFSSSELSPGEQQDSFTHPFTGPYINEDRSSDYTLTATSAVLGTNHCTLAMASSQSLQEPSLVTQGLKKQSGSDYRVSDMQQTASYVPKHVVPQSPPAPTLWQHVPYCQQSTTDVMQIPMRTSSSLQKGILSLESNRQPQGCPQGSPSYALPPPEHHLKIDARVMEGQCEYRAIPALSCDALNQVDHQASAGMPGVLSRDDSPTSSEARLLRERLSKLAAKLAARPPTTETPHLGHTPTVPVRSTTPERTAPHLPGTDQSDIQRIKALLKPTIQQDEPQIAIQSSGNSKASGSLSQLDTLSLIHFIVANSGSQGKALVDPRKYKTRLCCTWEQIGTCPYAETCCFAHGESELRTLAENHKQLASIGYFSNAVLLAMANGTRPALPPYALYQQPPVFPVPETTQEFQQCTEAMSEGYTFPFKDPLPAALKALDKEKQKKPSLVEHTDSKHKSRSRPRPRPRPRRRRKSICKCPDDEVEVETFNGAP